MYDVELVISANAATQPFGLVERVATFSEITSSVIVKVVLGVCVRVDN